MKNNNNPHKSGSFSGRNIYKNNDTVSPGSPYPSTVNEESESNVERDQLFSIHDHNLHQVSEDIDRFTDTVSTAGDKSRLPEVPDTVETYLKIIESRISKYYSGESGMRSGKMTEEDSFFIEAVSRISKLTNAFSEFHSNTTTTSSFNRTSTVLQRAMTLMEDEFRALLEDSRSTNSISKVFTTKNASFNSKDESSDRCILPESKSTGEEEVPAYSPEVMCKMNKIATTMILAGYQTECRQVYTIARRNICNEQMKKLEYDKINMEDVQRMHWETLEGEVVRWIHVVKHCYTVLFPGERKLGEIVFSDHPSISRSIFDNFARAVVIQHLDFAEAVAMTKRSAEKLFKFLDMYETLRELILAIVDSSSKNSEHQLNSEISAVVDRIGEAVVNIFSDLENSIKSDAAKSPVPGGAVHPLTRYVMNYLKYACEYKDSLEQIFHQHAKLEHPVIGSDGGRERESPHHNNPTDTNPSPFSIQLLAVMDLLDTNLEAKSRLYKDLSLRSIFLMNNSRYILQKVKGSTDIHQLMGDTWCRRRSSEVRQFHKNYQRDTWIKLLQCLNHEGLQVNGKVQKTLVKEKLKSFSNMFDEIHKTQSTWVVSDEQLLSEIRVSISAVVIPAYRSFLGRFRQHLDSGRHAERYIKYQLEDIETLIEGLFDGNSMSMNRRR